MAGELASHYMPSGRLDRLALGVCGGRATVMAEVNMAGGLEAGGKVSGTIISGVGLSCWAGWGKGQNHYHHRCGSVAGMDVLGEVGVWGSVMWAG